MNSDPKNPTSLRLGIAGAGFGLRVLLPVFAGIEGVRVVAISGRSVGAARLPPGCLAYPNWETMLRTAELDAAAIALPPLEQERAAAVALASGLHLFCEKPLALCPSVAEALARDAQRGKRVGCVDFEIRKIPAFEMVRKHLSHIGRPLSLTISWKINARVAPPPPGSWKYDAARGGGAMSSFGCHLVDLCTLLLGRLEVLSFEPRVRVPERPSAAGVSWRITAEDAFDLTLRSADGAEARIEMDTVAERDEGLHLAFAGAEGRLLVVDREPSNYFAGWDVLFERPNGRRATLLDAASPSALGDRMVAVRRVAVDFVRAVFYGGTPDSSLEAGVENVRVVARARALAASIPR